MFNLILEHEKKYPSQLSLSAQDNNNNTLFMLALKNKDNIGIALAILNLAEEVKYSLTLTELNLAIATLNDSDLMEGIPGLIRKTFLEMLIKQYSSNDLAHSLNGSLNTKSKTFYTKY